MDLDEIKRGFRAEIKKRENEQYFTFQCNVRQMCKDVLAKLEEQESEIAELKQKLEDTKATAYAESVDAGMRERRLKRALWMARAYRAEARKNYWYARSVHEGDERLWSIDGSAVKYIGCIKRTNFDWLKTWSEVEIKCLAKAEADK